jgi:hypothetical protein
MSRDRSTRRVRRIRTMVVGTGTVGSLALAAVLGLHAAGTTTATAETNGSTSTSRTNIGSTSSTTSDSSSPLVTGSSSSGSGQATTAGS